MSINETNIDELIAKYDDLCRKCAEKIEQIPYEQMDTFEAIEIGYEFHQLNNIYEALLDYKVKMNSVVK